MILRGKAGRGQAERGWAWPGTARHGMNKAIGKQA